ncbi:ABC transporter permease subunit [Pseudoroseomonas cervicalis]|uniref:ABC transporter permease subunit n=1 Tax=Teichococcus cervicalis TaxID=204525 RepID=UPI0022F1A4F8|nr:ABC transporter permease subunit [Pseudoroseomonas cervicalis]WBV44610.1 ABC transporter permease subunit [Pseudoroseomonas cervicalis]
MAPRHAALAALPAPAERGTAPREALAVGALAALAALSPVLLGLLSLAPNRLLSPRPLALPLTAPIGLAGAVFLVACLAMALLARRRALLPWAELAAALAATALLAMAGLGAGVALAEASPSARAMPAAGLWVGLLLLLLGAGAAAAGRGGTPTRFLGLALAGAAALLAGGWLDGLSLVREAAQRGPELRAALAQHLALSGGALALALALALPLGLAALRRPRLEAALLGVANGVQVVPSIALFGLLMPPLAALAAAWPALRAWGIGGIGPAPAVLGIAAYLLLPLSSQLLAGLRVAPPALVEAARGQGMKERQILWRLRLPLGLGVVLGGLRLAAVQAVGLATLAALIGGGGLGALIFQGIGQLATDLILLGVLPVVALSLAVDAALAALQSALEARA